MEHEVLDGRRYGRLKVIAFAHKNKHNQECWQCMCDCGKTKIIIGYNLRKGFTKSCGCLFKEQLRKRNVTHGLSKTPEYKTWCDMRDRCSNKNHPHYGNWGGRGIKVCRAWQSFEVFYKDMGKRPVGTSLDRKNNNKGYNPTNCRWATRAEQLRNRRNNVLFKGECAEDASKRLGGSTGLVRARLRYGWTRKDAFTIKNTIYGI